MRGCASTARAAMALKFGQEEVAARVSRGGRFEVNFKKDHVGEECAACPFY
jgi:hypothetical protein